MRIIFIRHGDPDYSIDFLTEKGTREAAALAKWVKRYDDQVKAYYVSPLGRAKETCRICLEPLGKEATVLPWIREYTGLATDPYTGKMRHAWDFFPGDWTKDELFYSEATWLSSPWYKDPSCKEGYETICGGLDALLAEYGYVRDGHIYRTNWTDKPNDDTIVIFCHMISTLTSVAHLTGIAAPLLWHGFFSAPTGITMLQTEERQPGIAWFRVRMLGDVTHLLAEGEPVSDSGFFPS